MEDNIRKKDLYDFLAEIYPVEMGTGIFVGLCMTRLNPKLAARLAMSFYEKLSNDRLETWNDGIEKVLYYLEIAEQAETVLTTTTENDLKPFWDVIDGLDLSGFQP